MTLAFDDIFRCLTWAENPYAWPSNGPQRSSNAGAEHKAFCFNMTCYKQEEDILFIIIAKRCSQNHPLQIFPTHPNPLIAFEHLSLYKVFWKQPNQTKADQCRPRQTKADQDRPRQTKADQGRPRQTKADQGRPRQASG